MKIIKWLSFCISVFFVLLLLNTKFSFSSFLSGISMSLIMSIGAPAFYSIIVVSILLTIALFLADNIFRFCVEDFLCREKVNIVKPIPKRDNLHRRVPSDPGVTFVHAPQYFYNEELSDLRKHTRSLTLEDMNLDSIKVPEPSPTGTSLIMVEIEEIPYESDRSGTSNKF